MPCFNISVYFCLIGLQASLLLQIPRVSQGSAFYFITSSREMRSLISLGSTLDYSVKLSPHFSSQQTTPHPTPKIIEIIMVKRGEKTTGVRVDVLNDAGEAFFLSCELLRFGGRYL